MTEGQTAMMRLILLGMIFLLTTSASAQDTYKIDTYTLANENMVHHCRTSVEQNERDKKRLKEADEERKRNPGYVIDLFAPQEGESYEYGMCFGVIVTVLELKDDLEGKALKSCLPPGVSYGDVINAVLAHAERGFRPKEHFISFIFRVLHDEWPCKTTR
jgi:hypothetical protein